MCQQSAPGPLKRLNSGHIASYAVSPTSEPLAASFTLASQCGHLSRIMQTRNTNCPSAAGTGIGGWCGEAQFAKRTALRAQRFYQLYTAIAALAGTRLIIASCQDGAGDCARVRHQLHHRQRARLTGTPI